MDSKSLLSAVRAAQGLPSNYALARFLGIPDKSVQRWNVLQNTPDDATASRLAELAGLDPDSVVAAMHAQRAADDQERTRWQRIASRLQSSAATAGAVILSLGVVASPDAGSSTRGSLSPENAAPFCILCKPKSRRALLRRVAAWLAWRPQLCGWVAPQVCR